MDSKAVFWILFAICLNGGELILALIWIHWLNSNWYIKKDREIPTLRLSKEEEET